MSRQTHQTPETNFALALKEFYEGILKQLLESIQQNLDHGTFSTKHLNQTQDPKLKSFLQSCRDLILRAQGSLEDSVILIFQSFYLQVKTITPTAALDITAIQTILSTLTQQEIERAITTLFERARQLIGFISIEKILQQWGKITVDTSTYPLATPICYMQYPTKIKVHLDNTIKFFEKIPRDNESTPYFVSSEFCQFAKAETKKLNEAFDTESLNLIKKIILTLLRDQQETVKSKYQLLHQEIETLAASDNQPKTIMTFAFKMKALIERIHKVSNSRPTKKKLSLLREKIIEKMIENAVKLTKTHQNELPPETKETSPPEKDQLEKIKQALTNHYKKLQKKHKNSAQSPEKHDPIPSDLKGINTDLTHPQALLSAAIGLYEQSKKINTSKNPTKNKALGVIERLIEKISQNPAQTTITAPESKEENSTLSMHPTPSFTDHGSNTSTPISTPPLSPSSTTISSPTSENETNNPHKLTYLEDAFWEKTETDNLSEEDNPFSDNETEDLVTQSDGEDPFTQGNKPISRVNSAPCTAAFPTLVVITPPRQEKIEQLQEQLTATQNKVIQLQLHIKQIEESNTRLSREKDTLSGAVTKMKQHMETATKTKTEPLRGIQALKEEIRALQQQNEALSQKSQQSSKPQERKLQDATTQTLETKLNPTEKKDSLIEEINAQLITIKKTGFSGYNFLFFTPILGGLMWLFGVGIKKQAHTAKALTELCTKKGKYQSTELFKNAVMTVFTQNKTFERKPYSRTDKTHKAYNEIKNLCEAVAKKSL